MHERPIRTDVSNWYCMKGKKVVWAIIAVAAALIIGLLLVQRARRLRVVSERLSVPIEGAVIQRDTDTNKQLPIGDVVITASDGVRSAATRSDAAGYFKLVLHKRVLSDLPIKVTFRHPRYQPLDLTVQTGRLETPNQLYIAAMVPIVPPVVVPAGPKSPVRPARPPTQVSNIRVRYTLNTRTQTNVGFAVRTFQVVNQGNGPCDHRSPCSPDGKWMATSTTVSLDAGLDNTFSNITASCIAGPCPFTRIDSS